jgi:integrase
MARSTRDSRLETRTPRLKLKPGIRYWRSIGKGLALGYRRTREGFGTWTLRWLGQDGKYHLHAIGQADDFQEADGADVLDFFQAQDRCRELARQMKEGTGVAGSPYTVADAMREYLSWYGNHRKAVYHTRRAAEVHILPALGKRVVAELTAEQLRQWHERLANTPAMARTGRFTVERRTRERESEPRARKATANRVLTILKAALNHAYHDGKVPSDDAWRRVKPFHNVDSPKIGYLSVAEATRLVNACEPAFRPLVQAALLTGCRYGELIKMACHDFNPDAGCITVLGKSGKIRHVPLTDEGQRFFERVAAGRPGGEVVFCRADGAPWGASHQQRPLERACEIAGIDPAVSFHVLRHTYGSLLAMRGVPLQVIAEALGHADTRITSRHYAHLMPSYVADTIRKHLPNFGVERDNITPLRIAP